MSKQLNHQLGLVLSGGGVKGFAHAGLIKALEEENIYPDIIAGASAGSLIGSLYANGFNSSEIMEKFRSISLLNPANLTILKPGFIDLLKFRRLFEKVFPEDSFESLKRKIIINSTNMETGEVAYHRDGPLIEKIFASCAAPGVFSPILIEGVSHMDGGMTSSFPIEAIKHLNIPIIGSYVCYPGPRNKSQLTNSIKLLIRSSQIMLWTKAQPKFELANFVFCPEELSEIGFFDTRRIEDAFEIGYHHAKANMEEMKKLVFNHGH